MLDVKTEDPDNTAGQGCKKKKLKCVSLGSRNLDAPALRKYKRNVQK